MREEEGEKTRIEFSYFGKNTSKTPQNLISVTQTYTGALKITEPLSHLNICSNLLGSENPSVHSEKWLPHSLPPAVAVWRGPVLYMMAVYPSTGHPPMSSAMIWPVRSRWLVVLTRSLQFFLPPLT